MVSNRRHPMYGESDHVPQAPDVPAAGEGPKEPVTWQDVLFVSDFI